MLTPAMPIAGWNLSVCSISLTTHPVFSPNLSKRSVHRLFRRFDDADRHLPPPAVVDEAMAPEHQQTVRVIEHEHAPHSSHAQHVMLEADTSGVSTSKSSSPPSRSCTELREPKTFQRVPVGSLSPTTMFRRYSRHGEQ